MSEPNEASEPDPSEPRTMEAILASANAFAVQRAAQREERRTAFQNMMPEPKRCIVAWVDLLGFRAQICDADTPEKFQAAYRRMREVHEEFGKETATLDPDQAELNVGMGKRVIALSDGLVIALNLEDDNPMAEVAHRYDQIGAFLEDLRFAQARCASAGNFVRGGVADGYFWFEGDILLSPALVTAYEMESSDTLAQNPVIILQRDLSERIRALRDEVGYSEDSDPMRNLFRDCEWMAEPQRSQHVMLNFMPVFDYDGNATPFLTRYHQTLLAKREAAPSPRARAKYDWLIQYAREFVQAEYPQNESMIFGEAPSPPAPSA